MAEPHASAPDRRRLAEVFGEILPDTTADERSTDGQYESSDEWYRHNRPPHHDG